MVYGQFSPDDLAGAIRAVAAGEKVTRPPVAPALLDSIQSHLDSFHDTAEMESLEPLTEREKEILNLIALGKGNREIAAALDIEEKTVKNHINNIYSKLQLGSRYEAISYMLRPNT
jgi:DNA-binding NarL/FixJ family response regulator